MTLLDAAGEPTTVLCSGHRASIRIDFDAHTLLEELVCGIAIHHLHGQLLIGTNTRRRGVTINRVQGAGSVRFDFDSFPLLEGVYDLTAAISDSTEVHEYDHWEKRTRFEVDQTGIYDMGSVVAGGTWVSDVRRR